MAMAEGASGEVKRIQVYAGPTGLLLVLLLFLVLPMATASCSVPVSRPGQTGAINVSVTGADLVLGDDPGYSASGIFELSPAGNAGMAREASPRSVVRVFGIATVVVMSLGLLIALIQVRRLRALVTAVVASVAAVLLAVTEFALVSQWVSLAEETAESAQYLPQAQGIDVVGRADEVVAAGWGFWLTLAGLALVAGINVFLLVRPGTRRRPSG
ncbi:hypothetical protein P3102_20675 [Amycolatopsis sp. QT-25]|uniref:hypothetical protein n=1 Tax=Amycolatopsis sp. QT-25 TaxID=3034022 RepID=UPI0023EDFA23|nr:hypothetical protein [Amycolatopsis sp. QT-25]WET76541.1 hypothetical protein P3102_20675 [Amycolatopsis sp. QT-25]